MLAWFQVAVDESGCLAVDGWEVVSGSGDPVGDREGFLSFVQFRLVLLVVLVVEPLSQHSEPL